VCGESVGTRYKCPKFRGIKMLFLYHSMEGMGFPSAIQFSSKMVPTLTVCGESVGFMVILGASEKTMISSLNNSLGILPTVKLQISKFWMQNTLILAQWMHIL